ncbi:HAD family hydrolase [Oscillatoriales cyanobacterium LEGE 11467]|uniref:HAD family hydrolase n=1 Tax=Zarconia navalis LEGE 11467 TaxID=1828826 RepID=A0A928VYL4_9CYAN|nr:HAD family hydrolase [Zarconia navalis]MBE9040528.1 HAD family hydrolase [Zarconia navalis LEGE 11467]
MPSQKPTILALDFDGVLCNGLIEYFQTAWRTYCQIRSPQNLTPPEGLAESFYRLRPVIETGWEMPVLVEARLQGIPEAQILQNWGEIAQTLVAQYDIEKAQVAAKLDRTRDEWISTDLSGWLSLHQFYPGVVERLRGVIESDVLPVIITTKEGRFVRSLLAGEGIELPPEQLFGKETKKPKYQILRELRDRYTTSDGTPVIWFIEDRLKTLQLVSQQPDLTSVRLFLADWGYNTERSRNSISSDTRIDLLSLSEFCQDFGSWL